MKKILKQFSIISLLVLILIFPYFVFASGLLDNMRNAASGGYDIGSAEGETSLATILGTIVQVALSLLGIIFIILIIYAGYNWMTAGGDEGKVETAKKTLSRAIIGLIILVSSVAIWAFVARVL